MAFEARRRHPFLYAAIVPMAVSFYFLLAPPAGLGQMGMFVWLLTFSVLVRCAMTVYYVPHVALGAELTTNFNERTTVVGYRILWHLWRPVGGHHRLRLFLCEFTGISARPVQSQCIPRMPWCCPF